MENIMTNGFCELNENEMMMVDGGATIGEAIVGAAGVVTVFGVTPVVATIALCGAAAPVAIANAPLVIVGCLIAGGCAIGKMITSTR